MRYNSASPKEKIKRCKLTAMLVAPVHRNCVNLELKKMFKQENQERQMENLSRKSNSFLSKTKSSIVKKKNQRQQVLNKNLKRLLKSYSKSNLLQINPRSLWKKNDSQKNSHQLVQSYRRNRKDKKRQATTKAKKEALTIIWSNRAPKRKYGSKNRKKSIKS